MKTSLSKFILLALCTGGLAALPVGCAGTSPTVSRNTGEYTDDSVITEKVTAQLVEDLSIKNERVKVQTDHGVVTLTGAVETPQLRERAERIAAGARGVRSVNNQIILMKNAPPVPASSQP
jgi:hypothetical protein